MPIKAKIALNEPYWENDSNRYFSLRIKPDHHIEPTEYPSPSKLLIISNVQGNFERFRDILLKAGVINKSYHWTFGNGHLVIAGNCFDKNGIGIECLWLVYALEEKAQKKGGYVHFVLGENEVKNLNGNWQYMQPKYANSEKTTKAPYVVLYDGNCELRRWLQTKNIIEKIGNILISHADMNIEMSCISPSITQLNNTARRHYFKNTDLLMNPLMSNLIYHSSSDLHNKLIAKKTINNIYVFTSNSENTYTHNNEDDTAIDILLVRKERFYRISKDGLCMKIPLPL